MGEWNYARDNVPPGLVVDDQIVDPYGDDFYLASHRGLLVRKPDLHRFFFHHEKCAFSKKKDRIFKYLEQNVKIFKIKHKNVQNETLKYVK